VTPVRVTADHSFHITFAPVPAAASYWWVSQSPQTENGIYSDGTPPASKCCLW